MNYYQFVEPFFLMRFHFKILQISSIIMSKNSFGTKTVTRSYEITRRNVSGRCPMPTSIWTKKSAFNSAKGTGHLYGFTLHQRAFYLDVTFCSGRNCLWIWKGFSKFKLVIYFYLCMYVFFLMGR